MAMGLRMLEANVRKTCPFLKIHNTKLLVDSNLILFVSVKRTLISSFNIVSQCSI